MTSGSAGTIALKLLDGAIADDTASRARFLREARLASAITHAHVCTVHDVGEIDGRLFIAMQYVQGQTLRHRIGGCPLAFDELYSHGAAGERKRWRPPTRTASSTATSRAATSW